MPGNRFDAVFFDFDGVLADSEPVHFECWREVLEPTGIHLSWERYERDCIGVSDRAMLEVLAGLREPKATIEELWPLYPDKKELFRRRSQTEGFVDPTVLEWIKSRSDLIFAVVTSSGRSEVEPILERAGVLSTLNTVVYGDSVKRLKPAPDPYLLAAERTGAKRPVVFEDSEPGVASGKAAGFEVVRVRKAADLVWLLRSVLAVA